MAAHDEDLGRCRGTARPISITVATLQDHPELRMIRRLWHALEKRPPKVDQFAVPEQFVKHRTPLPILLFVPEVPDGRQTPARFGSEPGPWFGRGKEIGRSYV